MPPRPVSPPRRVSEGDGNDCGRAGASASTSGRVGPARAAAAGRACHDQTGRADARPSPVHPHVGDIVSLLLKIRDVEERQSDEVVAQVADRALDFALGCAR